MRLEALPITYWFLSCNVFHWLSLKMPTHAPNDVICEQGVKNNYIFGNPTPIACSLSKFIGLRRPLRRLSNAKAVDGVNLLYATLSP